MNLGNIRLSRKLGSIMLLSLSGLIITTYLGLSALNHSLLVERERQAQSMVEATFAIFESLQREVDEGTLTLEHAQSEAKDIITAIRYGEDDYLWVNDINAVMVAHATKPSLNGKDMSTFKDPDGKALFSDIAQLARSNGEGSIEYRWPKPGFDDPVEKISYIKLYEPWGWVIGTGVYLDAVQDTFFAEASKQAVVFVLGAALLATLAILVSKDIGSSVKTLSDTMKTLSRGEIDTPVPLQERTDEMGDMADSVEYFRNQLIDNRRLEAAQKAEEEAQKKRAAVIQKLASDFDMGVNIALESVASAAKQLDMTAQGMSATAGQTSSQATAVASASEQTSSNVQTVAAAAEELTASIYEVGTQVTVSTDIARKAAEKAEATQATVRSLEQKADQISEASALISEIADQTNMLALNATIEAARAGEAGKGFAVVASEVKALATQTGHATEEIGNHIRAVQDVSNEATKAIAEINSIIADMNEISSSVAAAVEEQSAATQEITRNIEQAAQGTQEVNSNIVDVNEAANDTGKASMEVLNASTQLNDQSTSLKSIVQSFLTGVKSA